MVNKDFFQALDLLEKERKISKDSFIKSLEAGISSAYKKETGLNRGIDVQLNPAKYTIRVFAYRTVVDEVTDEEKEISLEDARKVKEIYNIGDHFIDEELLNKLGVFLILPDSILSENSSCGRITSFPFRLLRQVRRESLP